MSAAAAGCWELRFQCAVAEERRVLRRLAGLDGIQGTSANKQRGRPSVVGDCRTVRGTNAEPGPSACSGVESTRSSRSGWRASRSVSERRRGRCRRRREERPRGVRSSVRPASASVQPEEVREETHRPVPSGCQAAAWACCVLFVFVLWWCDFATELLYIYMYFSV